MKTHLAVIGKWTACGVPSEKQEWIAFAALDYKVVDCGNCKRTKAYKDEADRSKVSEWWRNQFGAR